LEVGDVISGTWSFAWPEPWPSSAYVISLLLPASIVLESLVTSSWDLAFSPCGFWVSGSSPGGGHRAAARPSLLLGPGPWDAHRVAGIGRLPFSLLCLAGALASL